MSKSGHVEPDDLELSGTVDSLVKEFFELLGEGQETGLFAIELCDAARSTFEQ